MRGKNVILEMSQLSDFDLDWKDASDEIVTFIRKVTNDAGASGVAVGLSGGVDSSLVAKLAIMALGCDHVLGVLMPTEFTPGDDTQDALDLATELGARARVVKIQDIVEAFTTVLKVQEDRESRIPLANIRARVRMTILYFLANQSNYLVAGTGDRSEDLIGYFTKYGDGGVDFLPIAHLYKGQVRKLALFLGIPPKIANKPSSPQLYPGHKATDELPADYPILDRVEKMLFDDRVPKSEIARRVSVSPTLIEDVERRFLKSNHKRVYPPMMRSW